MKRFNFKNTLKGLNIEQLKSLKEYHLNTMLNLLSVGNKDSDKHLRYLSNIEEKIANLKEI